MRLTGHSSLLVAAGMHPLNVRQTEMRPTRPHTLRSRQVVVPTTVGIRSRRFHPHHPLSRVTSKIEADLRALDRLRIKPVFVFPGLSPNRRQRNQHQSEHVEACRARYDAWSKYESGNEEQATNLFDGRSCIQHWDLWRSVLRIFRHRNVEFMVAPYLPWAQV